MAEAGELNLHPSPLNGEEAVKQTVVVNRSIPRQKEVVERQVYRSPLDRSDWIFFGGLALVTALAVTTRLYKITEPKHVA